MTLEKFTLGKFQVFGLRDGFFHLDGGSMFGVVPKILWNKIYPADSDNRIKLALNSLLIDTGKDRILVETGVGTHLTGKLCEYYSVETRPGLVSSLENLGYSVNDIHFVINTHLHFDHCGGNTTKDENGELVPTFPNAVYIIQKCEWENALHPTSRDKPSYIGQFFLPLEKHGQLCLVEGDTLVTEGVEVILTPGHTACHQCVKIQSLKNALFFLGDMVPTSAHVGPSYIASYDLFPMETIKNKTRYFEQAVEGDWIVALNHDPDHYFGRIIRQDGKYKFNPLRSA